ncbi:hypothetical protein [Draconibacterium sp.]|uniref:hypothetical protein n=1 Tax=Draconibacterium sp. TaxID=1965318 RepID=UPI0035683542
MKKKVNKTRHPELDKFDRKQKKHGGSREKSSKHKYSIYDEFDEDEDDDMLDYTSEFDDEEE